MANEKNEIDIEKKILVMMIPNAPFGPWVHTRGLHELGMPELEIRNLPVFMLPSAGALLNMIADYMANSGNGPIKDGQTIELPGGSIAVFKKSEPAEEDHWLWKKGEVLLVTDPEDLQMECGCGACGAEKEEKAKEELQSRRQGKEHLH